MTRAEIEARTARLAHRIFVVANTIRDRPGGRNPADQIADASSSAAANYRSAGRARSRKEFVAKLGLANEEADETVYWLEHIAATSLGADLDLTALQSESRELRAIIAASYASARRGQGKQT